MTIIPGQRRLSLDFFRGATMFLLVGESTRLYDFWLKYAPEGSWIQAIGLQFHHDPWNGLRFWDLIQPFFMFIVGVSMAISVANRQAKGDSKWEITNHILRRCIILFLLGTSLHCFYNRQLVFELWNVLTQLSFTILLAYLIMNWPVRFQFMLSVGLLLLTEVLYRFTNIPGFDEAFVIGKNFGSFVDMLLMGKINDGGWVTINCIPTAVHTIWGVLAGKALLEDKSQGKILKKFLLAGVVALVVGYGLDWFHITPIIKRISTSSFVLASAGWAFLTLGASFWYIDIKGHKSWVAFFAIVGMNPIFIYMFAQTVGNQWFNGAVNIFVAGTLQAINLPETVVHISAALATLALEWSICYWLYKKKIFIKI